MQLNSLIGKKNYQKQAFLQNGQRVPLSAVSVFGNVVAQIKTADKEGYNALQLGIETKKKANKSLVNHSKKAGLKNTPRFFREIRVDDLEGVTAGMEINVAEVFEAGDIVDVTGTSKGKGWAGGVKRYGFHGGPRTHGQSDRERAPGSIGQTTTPGRVYKGKKMAGRMGQDTVTLKNLEVIEVTSDGVLLIKGLVPGSVNTILIVKKVGKNKKFVPLYKEEEKNESVDSSQSHVANDIQQSEAKDEALRSSQEENKAEVNGSSSVSEDASQAKSETQSLEVAQLNENQPTISESVPEVKPEAVLDSSEDVQAPIVSNEPALEEKKEVKEGEENANK